MELPVVASGDRWEVWLVKAIVVAGGEAHPEDAALLADADLVLAADSGAEWLTAVGCRPDLLVGDLDSVDATLLAELERSGVPTERHPVEKDETDAELALERAVEIGADAVTVLAALGGPRLDHELANLALIADPRWVGQLRDLRIVRGATLVRPLHGGGTLGLDGGTGAVVTLLPLGGDAVGVRTTGLYYPLDGETLRFGRSRGLSNVVVEASASVSMEDGVLLVIETATEGVNR